MYGRPLRIILILLYYRFTELELFYSLERESATEKTRENIRYAILKSTKETRMITVSQHILLSTLHQKVPLTSSFLSL